MSATAFISYSWDDDAHKEWVRTLAERLRADGVDVTLDQWSAIPGDQLPAFMERAIRDNEFVVIICTPRYKMRSDSRTGGVGYEGDIMTGEVINTRNNRKFIPVLRAGKWEESAPSWLTGKYYVNLAENPYSELCYEDLVRTLLGIRETAPKLGKPMSTIAKGTTRAKGNRVDRSDSLFEDIKITRVIVEDVTQPRNDGTAGSALYTVPFALSQRPPSEWARIFIENWKRPPRWSTMHRPGIARINGATVVLDGTTISEVESVHRETLKLVLDETNREYRELLEQQKQKRMRENAQLDEHRKQVEDAARRIKFE